MIPKLDWYQWLKYIHLSFGKSRHLEEFSMLVFIVKIVCCSKKKFSRDLGSLDSRQLLQLQLFSPIFLKFWTLLIDFILHGLVWIAELCYVPLLQIWIVWSWIEVNWFHVFRNCFMSSNALTVGILSLIWKWFPFGLIDLLHRFRKSIYV